MVISLRGFDFWKLPFWHFYPWVPIQCHFGMIESIYVCFKAFKAMDRSIRASRVAIDAEGGW